MYSLNIYRRINGVCTYTRVLRLQDRHACHDAQGLHYIMLQDLDFSNEIIFSSLIRSTTFQLTEDEYQVSLRSIQQGKKVTETLRQNGFRAFRPSTPIAGRTKCAPLSDF
jgi:hypothetical protein